MSQYLDVSCESDSTVVAFYQLHGIAGAVHDFLLARGSLNIRDDIAVAEEFWNHLHLWSCSEEESVRNNDKTGLKRGSDVLVEHFGRKATCTRAIMGCRLDSF